LSYLKAQWFPLRKEDTFEEWVSNRFGKRLYETFFKTYTEKVWGIPCTEIRADWAAQRIKELSLKRAIAHALFGKGKETTLIGEFKYPRYGPGMMWERCTEHVERMGGRVALNTEVLALRHDGTRVHTVVVEEDGQRREVEADHVVNSMPITHLVARLDPAPPAAVRAAAEGLTYRDFLIVALVVDREYLFPDNWIYIHSPEVQVGRIQNFKNWSPAMVPDPSKTCLGMEYFCTRGDGLWQADDADLIRLARQELERIGLARANEVIDGTVIRQPMAYPVYDGQYKHHLGVLRDYLTRFENLQTTGRAGMHRYNNQDHSMLTALLAAKNVLGDTTPDGRPHDLWDVNVERSYHEDFTVAEAQQRAQALTNGRSINGNGRPPIHDVPPPSSQVSQLAR
ncbi:MAG: hypothetical protein R3362_10740, partial [Rhodothermales bacterium]|nr:hypothetical protein [Rhodothermales bacterium]